MSTPFFKNYKYYFFVLIWKIMKNMLHKIKKNLIDFLYGKWYYNLKET